MSGDNSDSTAKRPSHIAYHAREAENDKSYFNRLGAAWEHRDGQGYNIQLESVPVDGRIILRTPMERLEEMRSEPEPDPQALVQDQQQETQTAPLAPEPQSTEKEIER